MATLTDLMVVMTTYTDPRTAITDALTTAEPVIAAVSALDPSAPTPCTEMNRGQLLAHLNAVSARILAMGQGQPATSVPDEIPSADYLGEWRGRVGAIEDAWAGRALDDVVISPWRPIPVDEAAAIYAAEVLVHAWDLASSSGVPFDISPELAAVGIESYEREIPPAARAAIFEGIRQSLPPQAQFEDPFGPAVEVDGSATPIARLVAMAGRQP